RAELLLELGIRVDGTFALLEFIERDRRLDSRERFPEAELVLRNRDDRLVRVAVRLLEEDSEGLALERVAWLVLVHHVFRRLAKLDRDEARSLVQVPLSPEDADDGFDLLSAERVEQVTHRLELGSLGSNAHARLPSS